jgi:hypothetical protein
MGQFRGDKAGHWQAELEKFKPIRWPAPSDGYRRQAAFAVHH